MFDVREPDLFQPASAAAAVLEVHLLERFGRDLVEPGVAGALLLGLEETGGAARRQGDGQVPDAVLVRRPDQRGVAEACAGVDSHVRAVGGSGHGTGAAHQPAVER
ncbi:conserved hypothetical protein [Streptomyces sviceus ATCC 29083]|uniref:Uncharacterized protein n=1 Tax=Streptomyces sviceus (strain ATCC 29083 / DSM 924 / JCM 4929 / NBRC 13980 / NCIMB 11184 / NRRL 5439 / UC 5370) TaxID=463191 RepID=B5I4D5_STRX2|nr:conserved hypothetical protein [Streptomyces sviceus ATCC 29083]